MHMLITHRPDRAVALGQLAHFFAAAIVANVNFEFVFGVFLTDGGSHRVLQNADWFIVSGDENIYSGKILQVCRVFSTGTKSS
jgi:hypothetical protein